MYVPSPLHLFILRQALAVYGPDCPPACSEPLASASQGLRLRTPLCSSACNSVLLFFFFFSLVSVAKVGYLVSPLQREVWEALESCFRAWLPALTGYPNSSLLRWGPLGLTNSLESAAHYRVPGPWVPASFLPMLLFPVLCSPPRRQQQGRESSQRRCALASASATAALPPTAQKQECGPGRSLL